MKFIQYDWKLLCYLIRRVIRYELIATVTGPGAQIGGMESTDDRRAIYCKTFQLPVYHGWSLKPKVPERFERRAVRKARRLLDRSPVKSKLQLEVQLQDDQHNTVEAHVLSW